MAAKNLTEEQIKKMTQDQMRMRSTNSTIAQGPLSAMTAAQIEAAPMRQGNSRVPMPKTLPIPMAIRRAPVEGRTQGQDDYQSQRSFNNPGMLDTNGNPLMALSDRQMVIPVGKEQSMNMRATPAQRQTGPREYASFGEFLKTMGLGK